MIPQSVRRVVAAAPQSPVVSSLAASSAPRAGASYILSSYQPNALQKRRYSSSKPSSPDDGSSRAFAARASVPAAGTSKTPGEKRKRKAKEPVMPPLPSVPSTRHIKDEALALSTFFALHRPISVTQLLPKTVTEESFAEIFNHRKGHKATDVLSTLSQAVHDLESPMSGLRLSDNDVEDGSTKISLKHPDGTESDVYFQLNSMSGHFLPFSPPPPPEPIAEVDEAAAEAEASAAIAEEIAAAEQEPETRVYKAVVTIEETRNTNGQYKIMAHSPQLVEDDAVQPRSFLERLALRQIRYEEARQQQGIMHAISVRRQKKLKIKKKKYKKLMRRTRNERRKQDRL
ncbi:hypothetical protein NEUTE1DRAFT_119080 [Neurospora tetrasperma FGSC 2508]|uniref:Small ribosomal subunit protein mS38 n=1 Tax=Neurospora tetrasperma (strain FGSC 2508 / ATCC MYA-4615 / P0657) TaxID=510951 RepID=F8N1E1_NEUT8|nr:uncharacterized protein NEUTE1DRAFT_119080 [Neurospora tetrasperma FGSC 2508]EGO53121.1 hypothetical protein NEUTE1DRAFT_119080 [Neurospora tetrasperma FGSC 2508]